MTENKLATKIANTVATVGGRAFFVGGAVRDEILGRPAHDLDIVVVGVSADDMKTLFPGAEPTGKAFPVFRISEIEVALARTERKNGRGHNGFSVSFGKDVTIEDDLRRRDLTMNAIAEDVLTGEKVDPFNGIADAKAGILREVDPATFADDPLRVLRAARFAAQTGFTVAPSLAAIMGGEAILAEVRELPSDRVWGEMKKALAAEKPSAFFRTLHETGALSSVFPEIAALVGQTQPENWHPEGDAFEHTMKILDDVSAVTDELEVRFAALMHDIGKGLTPKEMLPKHHGHDAKGAALIRSFKDGRFPARFVKVAAMVAEQHMKVHAVNDVLARGDNASRVAFDVLSAARRPRALDALRIVAEADGADVAWFAIVDEVFAPMAKEDIPTKGDIPAQIKRIFRKRTERALKNMAKE